THALLVCAKAMDRLGLPRTNILAVTMPGFATSSRTLDQAWRLMKALGCDAKQIDIRPSCQQMLKDLGHPFANGEPVYDITFDILDTEISPELVPADDKSQAIQSTESAVGPYELQDFHLYYTLRYGYAPSKVAFLAHTAWHDSEAGRWPEGAHVARNAYTLAD